MAGEIVIAIVLYPGVTHLDFTGPHQVLTRVPRAKVEVVSRGGREVQAEGLTFSHIGRVEDLKACDVLLVPGGPGCTEAMNDAVLLAEIRCLAGGARFITSVCTGSLVLAAAGLLAGRRAACHWAWRDLLPLFGALPDDGRVVRDGNILTGGGVTAGIDFALTLAGELAGREAAEAIQLMLEYNPAPPFSSGRPRSARPAVLARVEALMARSAPERKAAARRAADALARV